MKNPRAIKKAIIIASVLLLVSITVLTVLFGDKNEEFPDYSSYSTDSEGYKALFLLVGQMGYDTSRHERPGRFLSNNALMVVIKPFRSDFSSKLEQKYLVRWIEKGNTLLLIDEPLNIDHYDILKPLQESGSELQSYNTFSLGKGKVIYCTDLEGLSNASLGNMEAGIDFIETLDNQEKTDIIFNEYYHGFGAKGVTISDLLGQSGLLVISQIVLGVLLLLLISARRFGKPVPVFEIIKRRENENLFALSSLYIKSKSNALVLQMNLRRLKKDLSKFLGSNNILNDNEIIMMSKDYKFLSVLNIKELLTTCNYCIANGKIGNKKLHALIMRIEEVRKGII